MKVGAPAGARSQADGEGSQSHAELPIGASVLRSACTVGEGEACAGRSADARDT